MWLGVDKVQPNPLARWKKAEFFSRRQRIAIDISHMNAAAGYVKDNEWSPAIDAGNPAAAVGGEPKPNGGRINLGRFGGTDQASLSKRIGLIILMR